MRTSENYSGDGITQQTVAKRAGVSLVQVNRALNGSALVSEKTRLRVEQAALELGYEVTTNLHARTMAAKRHGKKAVTGMYAVILPSFGENAEPFSNCFFGPILSGLENEVISRGHELLIATHSDERLPRSVREGEVDGVVCLNWNEPLFETLGRMNLPLVTVQNYHPGVLGIAPADREGIRMATTHLIQLGHRRLAYLGLKNEGSGARRLHGFHDALLEAGLSPDDTFVSVSHERLEEGADVVRELLDSAQRSNPFTAIVCYNDLMAMQAVRELERQGLRVPDDISVTGFDDLSAAHHFEPQLTGISFDLQGMGRRAMQMLLEFDITSDVTGVRHEAWPVQLVVRQTSRAVV